MCQNATLCGNGLIPYNVSKRLCPSRNGKIKGEIVTTKENSSQILQISATDAFGDIFQGNKNVPFFVVAVCAGI